MEVVKAVKITVRIETEKRTVEKEFGNLPDLRWFMANFLSSGAERRSFKKILKYVGPERRMAL